MRSCSYTKTWPYFEYTRFFLSLFGMWPLQHSRRNKAIRTFFIIAFASGILTQVALLITGRNDITVVMNVIPPLTAVIASASKFCNYHFWSYDKMVNLMERMKRDWQEPRPKHESLIMHKFGRTGEKYSIYYAVCIGSTGVLFSAFPTTPFILDLIDPLNETRQRIYIYPAEYFTDGDNYSYYIIMLHMYVVMTVMVILLIANDSSFIVYIQHACALFTIAGHRITNALTNRSENNFEKACVSKSNTDYDRVLFSIRGHQSALQFAALVESAFTNAFFFVMGAVLFCLTTTLVQLNWDLSSGKYSSTMSYCVFMAAEMFHLFCLSYHGQILHDYSSGIFQKAYNAPFYNAPVKTQRLIILIMRRSLEPCLVSAGGIYFMLLRSFASILQTCVSYFTVLHTVQ